MNFKSNPSDSDLLCRVQTAHASCVPHKTVSVAECLAMEWLGLESSIPLPSFLCQRGAK
jgi:hypothetical protein